VGFSLQLPGHAHDHQQQIQQQQYQTREAHVRLQNATGVGAVAATVAAGGGSRGDGLAAGAVGGAFSPVWKMPHEAVGDLLEYVQLFRGGKNQCTDLDRMKRIVRKHYEEVTRVQVSCCAYDGGGGKAACTGSSSVSDCCSLSHSPRSTQTS
jgi:hypothetical protein